MALDGHIRLSGDLAHEQYRGYRRPGRVKGSYTTYKPSVPSDGTSSSLQKQVSALNTELKALKDQPVQAAGPSPVQKQPIEKEMTRKDVDEIIQRVLYPPKQRPRPIEEVLAEEKQKIVDLKAEEQQKIVDLKAERELVEMLKKQMDGNPFNDYPIVDSAPESLYDELKNHHIYNDWDE